MADFDLLPDYLAWANARSVDMLRQTPSEAGVHILAHLLAVELIWAARVRGEEGDTPQRPDWSLEECATLVPQSATQYREIAERQEDEQRVRYRNTRGEQFTSSVGDILTHVLAHGAYHRGQISQDVRQRGGEIIDVDFILFRRSVS